MTISKITPIAQATRREERRKHARSRMAGRLFAIFDLLCSTAREARACGDELADPLLTRLGGRSQIDADSPLFDAMKIVCDESVAMLKGSQPEEHPEGKPIGERP